MKEYILCSAIHYKDGRYYGDQPTNIYNGFVICGRRHHNCWNTLLQLKDDVDKNLMSRQVDSTCEGFITNTNRYVIRPVAYQIAKEAKQIWHHVELDGILTSEDLYYGND